MSSYCLFNPIDLPLAYGWLLEVLSCSSCKRDWTLLYSELIDRNLRENYYLAPDILSENRVVIPFAWDFLSYIIAESLFPIGLML